MSVGLLFPGQGSQSMGMGRELADSDSEIMNLWKDSERISAIPLREIYWDGDEAAMADTRNLQPALTVVNVGLWIKAGKRIKPACVAGHSLGEYSALTISGVLSLKDVISIVTLRGQLMGDADPEGKGGMAAILKLPFEKVEELATKAAEATQEMIIVANRNTPAQFVVSGTKKAVTVMAELVKAEKGRAIPLAVSGAFHSPLMEEASFELAKALKKVHWNNPSFPIYTNTTGTAIPDALSLADIMPKQMISPVLWIDIVRNMYNDGVRKWIELGPKAVVSKMVPACLEGVATEEEAPELVFVGNEEQIAALPKDLK